MGRGLFILICDDGLHFLQFMGQLTQLLPTSTYSSRQEVQAAVEEHSRQAAGQGRHPKLVAMTRCDLYEDV